MSLAEEPRLHLVRNYRDGDETDLVELFNEVYSNYAGFVPRSREYWRWCCLERPTVKNDGIRVVEKSGTIVAYAVVAIELTEGKVQANVLDFCHKHDEGEAPVRDLVEWITEYAGANKVDAISFDAPLDDDLLRRVVKEHGFSEFPHVIPLLMINDFAGLVQRIATSRSMPPNLNQVFHVYLSDATTLPDNVLTLEVGKGKFEAKPGKAGVATVEVTTTVDTFTSCLFGVANTTKAVLRSKIKVRPFWKLTDVIKLFSAIQLVDPWFIPAADFG